MNKLGARVDRLEGNRFSPAEVAAAAAQFDSLLARRVSRFSDADRNVPAAVQLQHWSPADRVAWLMRFEGMSVADAIEAAGFPVPRNAIEVALSTADALDLQL